MEEILSGSSNALKELLRWLGVDAALELSSGRREKTHATPSEVVQVRGGGSLRRLQRSWLWDRLRPWSPEALRYVARRFSGKIVRREDISESPVIGSHLLREHLEVSELALEASDLRGP